MAVVGLLAGILAGGAGALTGSRLLKVGFVAPGGYLALVLSGALTAPEGTRLAARVRLPLVLATTHICWGAGFLRGFPRQP